MISQIDLAEAQYNARDVLAMCRAMPHLSAALETTNTVEVYNTDEQMAYLALQMTRLGLPVNSERRAEIGARLRALRDTAINQLRPYTEGEYRESFLTWVADFFASKARGGEPVSGTTRIGPTRAAAEYDDVRAALAEWKAYRKTLLTDAETSPTEESAAALANADGEIVALAERVKLAKKQLAISQFDTDENDGLPHTSESAFEIRRSIRRGEAELAIAKKGVNFGAKIQQCAILRAAGVPLHKTTEKTGLPKIDKEVLEGVARHPSAKALLSYILTEKTINVYIEGEKRAGKGGKSKPVMVTEDGYIHPAWSVHKITGRWGSSPNCQNWSVRAGGGAENLRAMIEAPEGYVMVSADQCLAGGTLIDTPTGHIPIERIRPGMAVFTYHKDRPSCAKVLRTKFQGTRPTMLVTLDNGAQVRCTFDHPWITKDGSEIRARDLAIGASLLPLQRTTNGVGYEVLYSHSSFQYAYTHRVVAEAYLGAPPADHHVHHVDGNSRNNDPANLRYVSKHEHQKFHREATVKQWTQPSVRASMVKGIKQSIAIRGGYHGTANPNFGNKQGIERTCPECSTVFYTQRAANRLFCSRKCYNEFRQKHPRGKGTPYVPQNHKVAAIEYDGLLVPVYDIEVERDHNFALVAGVFVHNCQLEARLIAGMSQCKYMLDTFQRGEDIHSAFAAVGFPKIWPGLAATFKQHKAAGKCQCADCEMRHKMRDVTKRLEYGAFYGGKEQTLFESIVKDFPDSTLGQVREFLSRFNEMLPEVLAWRQNTQDEAIRDGLIRSPILGRMQVFPLGRVDPNVAYNYKAQSGGADIWAIGALKFMQLWDQEAYDVRLIQNGHDSVLILCREELAVQVEQDVYACWNMTWNGVPFIMESKIVKRWSGD